MPYALCSMLYARQVCPVTVGWRALHTDFDRSRRLFI